MSRADVEAVVARLRSPEVDDRRRALDELRSWQQRSFAPDVPDAAEVLLAAAAAGYPEVRGVWPPRPNGALMQALWPAASSVPPAVVVGHLAGLPGEARWAALRLLAENGSEDAAYVLARELRRLTAAEDAALPPYQVLLPLEGEPRHAEVLLPSLLALLRVPRWMPLVAGTILAYAAAGMLTVDDESTAADALRPHVAHELDALRRADGPRGGPDGPVRLQVQDPSAALVGEGRLDGRRRRSVPPQRAADDSVVRQHVQPVRAVPGGQGQRAGRGDRRDGRRHPRMRRVRDAHHVAAHDGWREGPAHGDRTSLTSP